VVEGEEGRGVVVGWLPMVTGMASFFAARLGSVRFGLVQFLDYSISV